jgi:hypothetical protein
LVGEDRQQVLELFIFQKGFEFLVHGYLKQLSCIVLE